jgi:nicotinamide mononucleotide transporter
VLEISANAINAVSILLAGRNSFHSWWTGILGCLLFCALFAQQSAYADVTRQLFFVATSVIGMRNWRAQAQARPELPVLATPVSDLWKLAAGGSIAALGYALLLQHLTGALVPLLESGLLALSVVAQVLLMKRRIESWWFWLGVNTLAVPLFFSRGLYVTAALYACFWFNALISAQRWRRLVLLSSAPR